MIKSLNKSIEGFLFDLEGVVIDSEHYRDKVTSKLLKSLGYEYNRDKIKPQMSGKPSIEYMES